MDKIEIRVNGNYKRTIQFNRKQLLHCGSMRCKMFDLLDEIEELS